MQKISSIPQFVLEILQILESNYLKDPFFTMTTQQLLQQLLISMNLYQNAKIRLFHHFVLEMYLIKNPAIWLVKSICKKSQFIPLIWFVPKIQAVTHNFTWVSHTMLKLKKKSIPKKFMDERMDGQALFIGSFWSWLWVQYCYQDICST